MSGLEVVAVMHGAVTPVGRCESWNGQPCQRRADYRVVIHPPKSPDAPQTCGANVQLLCTDCSRALVRNIEQAFAAGKGLHCPVCQTRFRRGTDVVVATERIR